MWFFFFNATATTEIYTDGHTLSLHDALPIFDTHVGVDAELGALGLHLGQAPVDVALLHLELGDAVAQEATDAVGPLEHDDVVPGSRELLGGRSEEHTSELQSLMRISYAVFCLNNNTKTHFYTTLTTAP